MFLEGENDEKMLKAMAIDGGFWRYKKHLRTFWNQGRCMVHSDAIWNDVLEIGNAENFFKAKTQNGAFSRYLKRFLGSWNCCENILKSRTMYGAFWRYLKRCLEVETAETILKARTQNGAFWRYLKQILGSWNCLEHFETKEAKWCIRTLFKECGPTTFRGAIVCRNNYVHH